MQCRPRLSRLPSLRWPLGIRTAARNVNANLTRPSSGHWNPERLKTTEKYPLSVSFSAKREEGIKGNTRTAVPADPAQSTRYNVYVRTQIVSPDLCDDVLNYIGPTLEKHRGCDILDLNPGLGLWSQKLHNCLQPRSHVLLESTNQFDEYLKPLVERPGSKYKLVYRDITRFDTYEALTEDGTFPHQTRVDIRDVKAQNPNNTLLVTGSLMWDPKLPGKGFDSMARQLLLQFAENAWANTGIHTFGPVRSLLWVAQDDFKHVIPRSLLHHQKYSLFLDTLSKSAEVVTSPRTPRLNGRTTVGREPQHELLSIIQAMRRGREKGIEMPPHRRENAHDFAEDIAKRTDGKGFSRYADMYEYLKEQEWADKSTIGINTDTTIRMSHIEKQLRKNPKMFHVDKEGSKKGKPKVTKDGKAAAILRATVNRAKNIKLEVEATANIGEEIYDLECKILGMQDGSEKESALRTLQSLEDKYAADLNKLNVNHRPQVISELEERLALKSPVPRLSWDARPFEPLIMQPDEVWPANSVSLVDCEPRPLPSGQTHEWYEWFQDFVFGLYHVPSTSVKRALEDMQPGASELIERAPSLKDPARGGRLNMDHLRVRMLTVEMVDELCRAYRDWPFKSPDADHSKYFRVKMGK